MFGPKKRQEQGGFEVKILISEGSEFEGNLRLPDNTAARLDGILKGNARGKATLIIGKEGRVFGDLELDRVLVYGIVEGNIKATEVELHGGMVNGDIITQVLYVEKGSILNGKCTMEKDKSGGAYPQGD